MPSLAEAPALDVGGLRLRLGQNALHGAHSNAALGTDFSLNNASLRQVVDLAAGHCVDHSAGSPGLPTSYWRPRFVPGGLPAKVSGSQPAKVSGSHIGEPSQLLRELATDGARVATTRAVTAHEMSVDFLAHVKEPWLRDEALALLSLASSDWDHKSPFERVVALEHIQSRPLSISASFALQWLQSTEGEWERDSIAEVALLTQWRPAAELPALILWGPPNALAQAIVLAEAAPRLALAYLVEEQALAATLNAQTSRARTLLQDSIVRPSSRSVASSLVEPRPGSKLNAQPRTHGEEDVGRMRAGSGFDAALREPVVQALRDEARRAQQRDDDEVLRAEAEDRARSAVERFLYELLQRSPRTRDVFELNALLPFRFGARALEADFAARSIRLVLEVDGYFHFNDFDAYRRDRRKDVLLQQHGYLVARFLADDVLERTATVLAEIEQLVASRRTNVEAQED